MPVGCAGETVRLSDLVPSDFAMLSLRQAGALLALITACVLTLALYLLPDQLMVDEHFHHGQILFFLAGEFIRVPEITVLPGYHLAIVGPAALLGVDQVQPLRAISAVLGASVIMLAWLYWLRHGANQPLLRSLQLLTCPLLWPFYVLLYTDLVALAVLVAALTLADRQRFWAAVVVGLSALLVRQTNVFWLALLWLMAMHQAGLGAALTAAVGPAQKLRNGTQALLPALKSTWPLLLPLLAFMAFLVLNRGVAIGDRASHQLGGIYPSQIFFMLLVLWLALLPLHLANLGRIGLLLHRHWWIAPALLLLGLLYWFSFAVTHHYNLGLPEFHLRNRALGWLDQDWRVRLLAFPLMAWSLLSIAVSPLKEKAAAWLFPVTLLAMLPAELIEQRYYIPPLVLWLLFRQPGSRAVEIALLAWFVALSLAVYSASASLKYFL